jgi:hypothetical protein
MILSGVTVNDDHIYVVGSHRLTGDGFVWEITSVHDNGIGM